METKLIAITCFFQNYQSFFAFYSSDVQSRTFLPSRDHLAISGNIFVVNNPKRGATGHTVGGGKGCERHPTNNKN